MAGDSIQTITSFKAGKNKSGNSESSDGGESGSGTAGTAGQDEQPDMPAIVLTPQERQAICTYVEMMNDVGLQQGEELKPQVQSLPFTVTPLGILGIVTISSIWNFGK